MSKKDMSNRSTEYAVIFSIEDKESLHEKNILTHSCNVACRVR